MHKVVLIEDDFIHSMDIKSSLEAINCEVDIANSASEAISLCQNVRYDLAIADVFIVSGGTYVPDGGLSFVTRVRSQTRVKLKTSYNVPIIVISGGVLVNSPTSPLENARSLGANYTLKKPFEMAELVAVVQQALAGKPE
ncbi:MAG: response regulator [Hyphomicrobiales bacterium]|jgi:two-component system phosphate regulon response regulator PhoB